MFKKTIKALAHTANIAALCTLVAFGAVQLNIAPAEAQEAMLTVSDDDMYCLQQNIFFEARNQSRIGQVAVAWVTLNRVDATRYPSNICDVVWQRKQFSWTHDGKADTPSDNVLEQRAWEDARLIAEVVVIDWLTAETRRSPIEDATMYHANYVDPYWASSYDHVVTVDTHIFYR